MRGESFLRQWAQFPEYLIVHNNTNAYARDAGTGVDAGDADAEVIPIQKEAGPDLATIGDLVDRIRSLESILDR
jgi:hypothetical protein